jgi:hypothetical protein
LAESRLRRFRRTDGIVLVGPQAKAWFCLLGGKVLAVALSASAARAFIAAPAKSVVFAGEKPAS